MVHVIEMSPVAYGGEFFIPVNINLEQELEAKTRKELAILGERYGIGLKDQYVEMGSVRVAVIELAEKLKTDLIVVGTHGHSGLGILLGSRANAILHYAKCDVLVVRI
jgi:universal stress protein A